MNPLTEENDKMNSHPAPQHRLADLRDWLMDRIDGGEEMRGEDGLVSDFIRQIDALNDQVRSLTRPKTIAEWQAAKAPTPASKTQQKRFAAQSEPRGCPTPGACSAVTAVAEQTRLRQMAEHERDSLLEQLIVAEKRVADQMTTGVSEWAQAWKEQK